MLALVHSSPTTLARYRTPNLGVLSSPRRWYPNVEGWQWAADNDAFSKWDEGRYLAMLDGVREIASSLTPPLFVTAPDVVGDADATLALFRHWRYALRDLPAAFVAQDGLTPNDVPWGEFAALFVGGSSEWKMGDGAAAVVRAAKQQGVWVHMGRVNSRQRIQYANALGCDSFDGTGLSWFKDAWLADFLLHASAPPNLLTADA